MIGSFYRGLLGTVPTGHKLLIIMLRAVVSIGILSLLLWWLPTATLLTAIQSIPLSVWFFVFGFYVLGHTFSALKWRLLLHAVKVDISPIVAVRAHGAGLFANLCLPSVVGGDFVRAGVVIRRHGQLEPITLGSLADRLNDTFALVLIAGVAGLMVPDSLEFDVGSLLAFVASLLLMAVFAAIVFIRYISLEVLPEFLVSKVAKFREALSSLANAPHIAFATLLLSIVIQSGFIMLNIVVAEAIGISVSPYLWFFAWPLAKLIALAPVSLGGIGVREVALSAILAPFGVEAALVVAQGLSWQAVLIFSGLFAGVAVASLSEVDVQKQA